MPSDLLTAFGKNEIWRSLGTDSYSVALRRIHRAAAIVESEFERMRGELGQAVDASLLEICGSKAMVDAAKALALPQQSSQVCSLTSSPALADVYDRFIADPRHAWSKRTTTAHMTTRRWVVEAFGAQTPMNEITREACREFVELLRSMPPHADKRYPNLTMREVIAAAQARGENRRINTANVNAYLNRFGGVTNWAINEGYLDRNPLRGLKLPDPVKRRDKRKPFSDDQLKRIFNAPLYVGCEDDERGYAVPGDQRPRRGRFWVPLIGLFSGMRLNEICQLEVSDILLIDGVACFRVSEGVSKSGEEKRVKNSASERLVPIHDELVRFGFLAFTESQRILGETLLFPELPPGHLGYRSTGLSRWFSRFLVSAEATAPLTCFHSFRHNFRDGLRAAKVDRDLALLLGGWTSAGNAMTVADNYGNGYTAAALAVALNAVRFPALDLDHLLVIRE